MSKQQEAPGDLELVREFVNTIDIEKGEEQLAHAADLARWLVAHGLASDGLRASTKDLAKATGLREALRSVLLSHNGGAPVGADVYETLDAAVCRARVRLRFHEGGRPARLEAEAGGVDGALGILLTIVHDAIASGTWTRLKACRDDTCAWAFYDHTRNHSGAWCNMRECGNRAKVRAYRQRHAHA